MILGLTGLKNSGKDTVAAYLVKNYKFERRAFADTLKRSVAALLDIPFADVDRWKNDPHMLVGATYVINAAVDEHLMPPDDMPKACTFREFLQRYGTESHREIFGQDFWLDAVLPVGGFYAGRAIVVTDCRFVNELERVKHLDGKIIRIDRGATPCGCNQDPHSSENEWMQVQPDLLITNNGSFDELYEAAEEMLSMFGDDRI